MTKYIFVTGGVVSGLGKGITAASLGRLLKARGFKVAAQKLDPYINVDPGTMSPYQHGEVYVTEDGAETDLDLGHYERFIDENLNKYSNLTTGKVYWNVLNKERTGEYLGETVQVIPHVTNEIKNFIYSVGEKNDADVVITEIGGTTGDIESQPFLEAIRQVSLEVGRENCIFIHVTLVPYIKSSGEHKSKPTQHSVKQLQGLGIMPNIIVTRSEYPIDDVIKKKISLFCNVKPDCVIENQTIDILYEVPIMLEKQNLCDIVCRELKLEYDKCDLTDWTDMVQRIKDRDKTVKIGLVGKYIKLHDAYLSVVEALSHAGYENEAKIDIKWIDAELLNEKTKDEFLKDCDGIIVPGGFGDRGIEGMITAAKYARENNIAYLGICLGMQIAVIEFSRNVLGMKDANSTEFDLNTSNPVISLMPDQYGNIIGGTMRLGSYPCKVKENSILNRCYQKLNITERHRHRYEFNNDYRQELIDAGLTISGVSPDKKLVEAVELSKNRFHVGVQYHPEFKSRPNRSNPIFKGFISAAVENLKKTKGREEMNQKKFVMSYSGGKDCMLAMYKKIKEGCEPVALITTIKKDTAESWTHGLNDDMLKSASKSLDIPIIYVECSADEYEEQFEKKLLEAKKLDASTVVYGDIDIELHRKWGEDRAKNAGLEFEFPLWQGDRKELVHEFIDSGFKAIIKKVNLDNMGEEFLGKVLDKPVIEEIVKTGSDACGENGEYHTFVVDGPIFKKPVDFKILGKTINNGYGYLDIK